MAETKEKKYVDSQGRDTTKEAYEFEKELIDARHRQELNYVASIYSDVSLYHKYQLEPMHFEKSSPWNYFFRLAESMINDGYEVLDRVSVDTYIDEKGGATKKYYEKFGGYDTIDDAVFIIENSNIEQYYFNVLKYYAIHQSFHNGFDVQTNWEMIKQMTYQEFHEYIVGLASDIFMDVELGGDKVIDLKDGMRKMVEEADEGVNQGIPYTSKLLTSATHGFRQGEMTILGGRSGEGKSFLATNLMVPSMIHYKEPILIICNEEDEAKWQRELLVSLINNHLLPNNEEEFGFPKGYRFDKGRFFEGNFNDDEWKVLNAGLEKFDEIVEDELLLFVNLSTFSMQKAIDIIKTYSAKMDIRYYILDTLKLDSHTGNGFTKENPWLSLQMGAVNLFDTIKKSQRNSHVFLTYQLNKNNDKRLTMESIGISKNVVDVASTVILARNVLLEEKGEDGDLVVRTVDGQKIKLEEDDEFMLLFLVKNRAGSTSHEIVLRTDKAHNIVTDIGLTQVPYD